MLISWLTDQTTCVICSGFHELFNCLIALISEKKYCSIAIENIVLLKWCFRSHRTCKHQHRVFQFVHDTCRNTFGISVGDHDWCRMLRLQQTQEEAGNSMPNLINIVNQIKKLSTNRSSDDTDHNGGGGLLIMYYQF